MEIDYSIPKAKRIHEGLGILLKYSTGQTAAEHDVFHYIGVKPPAVSKEDLDRLDVLGWVFEDDSWLTFT